MDGVPDVTAPAIAPGTSFEYRFIAPDPGTYWFHPHVGAQLDTGMIGALIVEDPNEPLGYDDDVTLVFDDWLDGVTSTPDQTLEDLRANGMSMDSMGDMDMDMSSMEPTADGMGISRRQPLGQDTGDVTYPLHLVNGRPAADPFRIRARPGQRLRLRLINAANARIFGLNFGGLAPVVVALDGQPVSPHVPDDDIVVVGPAMRVDLVIDMTGKPGDALTVTDAFYEGLEYRLVDLAYGPDRLRDAVPDWSMELPPNPLAEPDMQAATRHQIIFNGGMMGQMMMGGGMGSMMEQMREGNMWFINGKAATGHMMDPLLVLPQGTSHVLQMDNRTAWHHPMHLHGHSFRVITRSGQPTRHREWQDTVLMAPEERVEIAFVADNPGDWMFHCHILEHQAAGMMGIIRVDPGTTKT